MADDAARYRRRYERERSARLQAEAVAERAIADLQAAKGVVDREVAERTAQLQEALGRVGAADEVKTTFLRGAAHEMATPLHAVTGLVELIESSASEPDVRAAAREAHTAAARLHLALRTLVEFAAIGDRSITIDVEDTVLGAFADELSERWRLAAAHAGILFVVEVEPVPQAVVAVDPVRLHQILDALIDNAIRYGGGRVSVRLAATTTPEPGLQLTVEDEGDGVPAELVETVFEPFVRGDSTADGGFGIGLTLARRVAELLGGHLELETSSAGSRAKAFVPAGRIDGEVPRWRTARRATER